MPILPQVDSTQFCIKAAANITRAIMARARFSADELDEDGKLVAALFSLAAGERLSAPLDASFEIVSAVIPMDLFGPGYQIEFCRVREVYQRLKRSWILQAIGDNISEWIVLPSDKGVERLAAIFVLCRQHV